MNVQPHRIQAEAAAPPRAPSTMNLSDFAMDLADDLNRAASGVDVAYHLSGAFNRARQHFGIPRARIEVDERDQILCAIARAETAARQVMPGPTLNRLVAGTAALSALVTMLAESSEERARHPSDRVADLRARARIAQNDCHNLALFEEIAARARKRAATPA